MLAIHSVMQHAIESNEHVTTAVQQAAPGSQSCISINVPVDNMRYPSVYMFAIPNKAESIL
jgi:hypothetical protein